jgi:hypothetical protein
MKIAVVHNWPGMRNAELEIIKRISRIADSLGHDCTVISPFGHPLNSNGEHYDHTAFIDSREYDFCLNLHYVNPNFFDTFSYAVNWNPLDYVVRNPMNNKELAAEDIAYRTACLESHDALLSAGSEEMDDFAVSLNLITRLHIVNKDLYLHTSSGLAEHLKFPNFQNFRIFYIGANWERQEGKTRHDSLIELLDISNIVDFYGISSQHGIDLWGDVKNYKGELPFDGGKSILERSNQCGVSLVLHAKPHRRSGLVSTRIFQACASKTLTICDNNPFILEHFGNSVLSFDYTEEPAENFRRIMKKVEWINQNPGKAVRKARLAHRIFKEKFSLETEIANLFDKHAYNVKQYMDTFCTSHIATQVDVIFIWAMGLDSAFENFLDDVKSQSGIKVRAIVFVPPNKYDAAKTKLSKAAILHEIIKCELNLDGRLPLDGKLVSFFLKDHVKSPWFALYSHNCRWKRLHLTQLVRAVDDDCAVALSGIFVKGKGFSELTDDYYELSMKSINGHPSGISVFDIGNFCAGKHTPSSMLFSTAFFQSRALQRALGFFDKGWAFFLVVWSYLQNQKLPDFVPKLTTMFQRDDEFWHVDAYIDSRQTESFERSLGQSFLKYDPNYASLRELQSIGGFGNRFHYRPFSLNGYFQNLLGERPLFLKIYSIFFRVGRFLLGLPREKESSS